MAIDDFEVRRALDQGEFLPHFQPLVNLRTHDLHGFELLARWKHPQRGWISPVEFIPLAEKDGWIDQLTRELLRKGFLAAAELPRGMTLSLNISPVQLHNLGLPDEIQAIADEAGFSLQHLIVEITESAVASDVERALEVARALKSKGCRLALDDFGTGYSSLLHLQSLPFDELKVDRSFVDRMTEQRDCRKIVAAVVGLGQSLGLTTVAEGVEKIEQAEMLLWLGCELGQGYLYGKPGPAEMLASVVADFRATTATSRSNEVTGRISSASLDSLPSQQVAQLQAVYDGAPVGLAFLDRDLRYRNLNRRLANLNGRSMQEHLGRTVPEMVPALFPSLEPYIRRALGGESVTGVEVTKQDPQTGETINLLQSYEPARDEAGEVVGVSVALMEVTQMRRAEAAQRESEAHFRHMIEAMPQIPWIIDPEGRALDVSQRWLELTGTAAGQWRGFGWLEALHVDDRQPTMDAIARSLESGQPIKVVYRLRQSERDPWMRILSCGSARFDVDGKIMYWYGCLEVLEDAAAVAEPTDSAEGRKRLLLIDDDEVVQRVVRELFENEGFAVDAIADGTAGLALIKKSAPSILLLDLALPGLPGLEICRAVRRDRTLSELPIVMLTASDGESDLVVGLEIGADDYVTKPFKPTELLARVRALLRRVETRNGVAGPLYVGDLVIDPASFSVMRGGRNILLSTLEFRLLYFFASHPNRIFSRDQLLDQVWGHDRHVEPRSVDVYMRHLQSKVASDSGGGVALKTLSDPGYMLEVRKSLVAGS